MVAGTRLPGLPEGISRTVAVPGVLADAGTTRRWHYLDTLDALADLGTRSVGTILAVHGNPTWSYLWRSLITQSLDQARTGGDAWRIIAVDQLEMGFSDRTGVDRRLEQRIADLSAFTDTLGLIEPIVTLGHDWGGVISLGWATEHPQLLAAVMVLNTAVHQPEGVPIPAPLRLAGARGVLRAGSVGTTAFLDTSLALAHPRLSPEVRDAYRSPYRSPGRRRGIGAFVADIPADPRHPSHARLSRLADDVTGLAVPALMLWGPRDPIFGDRYLDDLAARLPHADVHRFEDAGHLVIEDAPAAAAILSWLGTPPTPEAGPQDVADEARYAPLWQRLVARRHDAEDAIVEMPQTARESPRRISWIQLDDRVTRLAAGLHRIGVRPGDRVSLLITPGATLTAVLYACLRIGAVVVVADRGLSVTGLTRALRGAWPRYLVGETQGLAAARALTWPGIRISTARLGRSARAAFGVSHTLRDLLEGPPRELPAEPAPDDPAAVLYTSGSTGPAKGVLYTHAHLSRLRDILTEHFSLSAGSGLVTGFAPFALLGPALGARSSTPAMDISAPRTLTATAVADAVAAAEADIVFLSPAAVLNVVETADRLGDGQRAALARVRTVLSTGAPVSRQLLTSLASVLPNAVSHAVYGMTECLLVSDITLDAMPEPDDEAGICVGHPIGTVDVRISPLGPDGRATGVPTAESGLLGEFVISAPHLKRGYHRLSLTDREAERDIGASGRWHRTGDIGHLDETGRLWVEGRGAHVIVTDGGPVAPVGIEQRIDAVPGVRRAAAVGIGPEGLRQIVAVVETDPRSRRVRLAKPALASRVRAATSHRIAAILTVPALPTDIRHNSKIDRTRLSAWAEHLLAGQRMTRP